MFGRFAKLDPGCKPDACRAIVSTDFNSGYTVCLGQHVLWSSSRCTESFMLSNMNTFLVY